MTLWNSEESPQIVFEELPTLESTIWKDALKEQPESVRFRRTESSLQSRADLKCLFLETEIWWLFPLCTYWTRKTYLLFSPTNQDWFLSCRKLGHLWIPISFLSIWSWQTVQFSLSLPESTDVKQTPPRSVCKLIRWIPECALNHINLQFSMQLNRIRLSDRGVTSEVLIGVSDAHLVAN